MSKCSIEMLVRVLASAVNCSMCQLMASQNIKPKHVARFTQ